MPNILTGDDMSKGVTRFKVVLKDHVRELKKSWNIEFVGRTAAIVIGWRITCIFRHRKKAERMPPANVSFVIMFEHPDADPEGISAMLGLKPSNSFRKGDRTVSINGSDRGTLRSKSSWWFEESFFDEAMIDDFSNAPALEQRLRRFLEPITADHTVVHKLIERGFRASLMIQFRGQFYFGDELSSGMLRTIADLGFTLGIEVFPNSAT